MFGARVRHMPHCVCSGRHLVECAHVPPPHWGPHEDPPCRGLRSLFHPLGPNTLACAGSDAQDDG